MKSQWRSSALIRRLLQIGGRSSTDHSDGGSEGAERRLGDEWVRFDSDDPNDVAIWLLPDADEADALEHRK